MKKKNSNKIRLGVFVSIAIAIFIAGIYFIGKKQVFFKLQVICYNIYSRVAVSDQVFEGGLGRGISTCGY